jgi:hypothetical protein
VVGAVDPRHVVDGIVVEPPAREGVLDPAFLGEAKVATLADHTAAKLSSIDPHAVIGLVTDLGVALRTCLDEGTDAAVPKEVDGRAQKRPDQLIRRESLRFHVERLAHLCQQRNPLGRPGKDPAALGDGRWVVVAPGRGRQIKQPAPLSEARNRIGVGIQENMIVVERAHELDVRREQHPVAEHIARHVADADDREVIRLDGHSEIAEMAPDRFPRPASGDSHLLMVVAVRSARGERVSEPEAILGRDAVCEVRQRGARGRNMAAHDDARQNGETN